MPVQAVAIVVYEGVQALDVAGPMDVFSEANTFLGSADRYEAVLVAGHRNPLRASNGIRLVADLTFEEAAGGFDIILEVDYAPGAASPPHRHAKSAFIYAYVISGEIESKVNNGETRIYKAGESWSEPPNAYHPISRNASKTKPAKLLAVFVVDSDDKPLTTPVK